jgi:parvulin-like peptidyl-prolyl isomerase
MRKIVSVVVFAALAAASLAAQQAQQPPPVPPVQQAPVQQAPPTQAPPAQAPAAQPAPAPKSEILEQILVKVNGDIITKTDLEARQVGALRQRTQQLSDEELKKAITEVTPDILVEAVDEMLLLQRGKELGYKVTEEQFKRVIENIRKENKLESDEQFAAALKQEGLSIEQLRKNLEKQMVINQVQQAEVFAKLGISEEEAQTYYNAHKTDFTTAASITLRELLVAVKTDGKGINVAADADAKTKADNAVKRARAGESFATLVAELSDAPSKANGGVVGPLSLEELDPAVRKLIEGLKPGGVTDVFRTPTGYALIQLESATEPVIKTFEAARDEIADKVYGGKRQAEFAKYLTRIRGDAIIEWKNEEMRRLYFARTAAAPAPKAPGL